MMTSIRIISGGQTGADRAALDAALDAHIDCGGWCPADGRGEDGTIPTKYPVTPLRRGGYLARTRRNVVDSDGTVILSFGPLTGGSEATRQAAVARSRPLLVIDANVITPGQAAKMIAKFVQSHAIATLNVAGPRASAQPEIGGFVHAAIAQALRILGA